MPEVLFDRDHRPLGREYGGEGPGVAARCITSAGYSGRRRQRKVEIEWVQVNNLRRPEQKAQDRADPDPHGTDRGRSDQNAALTDVPAVLNVLISESPGTPGYPYGS